MSKTLRDQIMDKYWIEFLAACSLDVSQYQGRIENVQFWDWFKKAKISKNFGTLEDYLA